MSRLSAPNGVWAYSRGDVLRRYVTLGKPDASKYFTLKPHYLTKVTGEKAYSSKVHKRKLADYAPIDIGVLRCPKRHSGEWRSSDVVRPVSVALRPGRVVICRVLTYPQLGNGLRL